MNDLTHELICEFVNDKNNDLIRHLDQVKEKWEEFTISDFKEIFDGSIEYRECDFSDFLDNFEEELFCEGWQGYDIRMIRDTWEELSEICRAIGIFGNGKNDVFNRMISVVFSRCITEKFEQFQEYKDLILEIVWVRRLVGAVMVRVGLI